MAERGAGGNTSGRGTPGRRTPDRNTSGQGNGAGATGRARVAAVRSRPTLHEVAKEAGTSRSTASRALSGQGYVAAEIRERVRAAAERIGYVPDTMARTLKGHSSRLVGLLVSDLRNQFYAELAAGVEQVLGTDGYQMVLVDDHGEPEREVAGATAFVAMRAVGVILTPARGAATKLLADRGVSVVEADRRSGRGRCDSVVIDNEGGAREVTRHLLELGHKRVALLTDETVWATGADRLRGYRAAHRAAGVPLDRRLVLDVGFKAAGAQPRVAELLDRHPDITALFAVNNLMAETAWMELRRRGLSVPGDVSLVSFDDMPWMRMVEPGVTAVAQPTYEMGRRAAQLLLRRIASRDVDTPVAGRPVRETMQPALIRRGSTAAPSGSAAG
ncbi:LacI family transcriptional regulator [Wenjunlia vitaminophila]|uniref:LacI family transcriptional regulator n=1 Tax=Wenjunlia vitaminophila TaxID=76728 RepID=A0A0T6LWM0_WENVI|nr:LacI family DNA-binding transcriptional regulator [Wenjunlia vitaminophila]KRV50408.1 LacI family transcriptional regulator [Wenjunlia vitaminophila]